MTVYHKPVHIVMADDDEEDFALTKQALNEAHLANQLQWVQDGEQLMIFLRKENEYKNAVTPDIILLDLNMPRKDGREALREIKADPRLRAIPVIMLTTSNTETDILKSYDLGANSYITKPVTFAGLVDVVKTLEKYWFQIVKLPNSAKN